ncbi:DDHD-domain-containing protein [Mytilinidion resinicola]|uniref:DDHD-domain-containing protein n=1 Tax=Mytilinidion resinicola TaxID=574789 RepID=A0A6A6Y1E7_9PEZI|nr:DDHD-domain-containing protein [Mytilinidion resinicola]KAF2802055.1 DDHD-domain-containing protein [Mytilinidion resinicola]
MSTPENKGYLSAGIGAFSPWTSRSNTPKAPPSPREPRESEASNASEAMGGPQRGGDHTISRRHRLSLRNYPRDCPALAVQWYHAIDIPKRKPLATKTPLPSDEKPPAPKKWAQFSPGDSRAIEVAFQKLADEVDIADQRALNIPGSPRPRPREHQESSDKDGRVKVPVNEDFLFDVDVEARELGPAYWLGPVYEVRRGTWFYDNTGLPCDENLATQLEEGYLKLRPWKFPQSEKRSVSQPRSRPQSLRAAPGDDYRKALNESRSNPITPKSSSDNLKAESPYAASDATGDESSPPHDQMKAHRLFGTHMNSVVTYQNATTAWLLTDDFLSRMSSTVYQRFAGGGHFAGVKLTRGSSSMNKKSRDDDRPGTSSSTSDDASEPNTERKPEVKVDTDVSDAEEDDPAQSPSEARTKTLARHMSSLVSSSQPEDPAKQEEEIRKRDEKEIRDDYQDQSGEEQRRDIEHLLLVTHGIGQRLGMRLESVNFVHDVNTLRKSLKGVYANSTDLQALNAEVDRLPKNCRIQVLPICWRHLLDFPKQSLKHNRKEHDLGDLDFDDQDYPNLEDITIEGVPTVRNLITDLALDILLYQSPAYKGHISRIVLQECNRIYRLFRERNPSFNGKVSLVGHSLGSAILFDILCHQKDDTPSHSQNHKHRRATDDHMKLDFPVEDFYALGSPLGLFQMLKGRTIAARQPSASHSPAETPGEGYDDPFVSPTGKSKAFEITTSRPKCNQLFNIFHPTDPISYRIEPLISPAMSALKPQPLPYTKKGIFGAPVGHGLTGIGARVGQSVSGLWTSLSSGIASSLINRSLGITGEDAVKLNTAQAQSSRPLSIGAGTNITAGGVIPTSGKEPDPAFIVDERKRRLGEDPITAGEVGEHPLTLIDTEIETLFSGFHKRTRSQTSEDARDTRESLEWQELEEKSRRLRREEAKVRALNGNGRVDYNIQEGSIASHLTYWADEDVGHFIISQLLARHRSAWKFHSCGLGADVWGGPTGG